MAAISTGRCNTLVKSFSRCFERLLLRKQTLKSHLRAAEQLAQQVANQEKPNYLGNRDRDHNDNWQPTESVYTEHLYNKNAGHEVVSFRIANEGDRQNENPSARRHEPALGR
ncbi:MAG: hypothetical protein KJN72_07110 [Woeseia sp.]|nr:hypothetical protein [Woeseia sp.]